MYEKYIKRILDFSVSLIALLVLSPILLILCIVGAVAMGGNPFFTQLRPGKKDKSGNEKIFRLIKFRTMSNKKDDEGNLLPDEMRLNKYGKFLRSTSLDELPELINIIAGDMSIVGPRPQLVRDMVFMTELERVRHTVRPGLTGLAQANGRNAISWEKKFQYDLEYIDNGISLWKDIKIILLTVKKVFVREGINAEDVETSYDLGNWLLKIGKIDQEEFDERQAEAKELIRK